MSEIEFQHVTKRFGNHAAVDDLSFWIDAGERLVLHGPSGCGKSTVLRMIAGFVAPDNGRVLVAGEVVASDRRILVGPERRRLAMVFQDLALWPHLTVTENLEFALKAQRLPAGLRRERIADILQRVQLADSSDAYPQQLSGGQQQRVAIARALVAQPVAVLMDEPLSNLDDELREELCGQILELHSQLRFTLIYVTHSREEMRRIGTRSIWLRAGREVSSGLNLESNRGSFI